MNIENLYLNSPVFIQSLFVNLQGQKIKHTRFNKDFKHYFDLYLNSNPSKINQDQLYTFLNEAKKTSFWDARFKSFDVNINETTDIQKEISKLPILTKQEVKNNLSNIVNINSKERIIYNHTSGTTGSGMVFPQTSLMENKQWAVWWRYRNWHGLKQDTFMGWFGGRSVANIKQVKPPFWRVNHPLKQIMFSIILPIFCTTGII